jgi:hypothetical protein
MIKTSNAAITESTNPHPALEEKPVIAQISSRSRIISLTAMFDDEKV